MRGPRPTLLLALMVAAGLAAGCGGDDSASKAPKGSPENPLVAQKPSPPEGGSADAQARSNEGSSTADERGSGGAAGGAGGAAGGSSEVQLGSEGQPGYKELVERQSRRPRGRFTPCNLVTQSQAGRIVGARMREPLEAPQGPTCIYRSEAGESFITIAVQTVEFGKLRPQLRQPQRVELSGRTAYCGQYGQPMLYLPLSQGRVLTIAGPCRVARQFAAAALRQL